MKTIAWLLFLSILLSASLAMADMLPTPGWPPRPRPPRDEAVIGALADGGLAGIALVGIGFGIANWVLDRRRRRPE